MFTLLIWLENQKVEGVSDPGFSLVAFCPKKRVRGLQVLSKERKGLKDQFTVKSCPSSVANLINI